MVDYANVLAYRFAGKKWFFVGDTYEGLDWFDETPKPTEAELEALWPELQLEIQTKQVEQARQVAYRETSDPIFFEYQRGDKTEAEWLAAVQAVKTAHPYPTPPKK
jgi:hypothetical protein